MKKLIILFSFILSFTFACKFQVNTNSNNDDNLVDEPIVIEDPTNPEDPSNPNDPIPFDDNFPEELLPLKDNFYTIESDFTSKPHSFIKVQDDYFFISNIYNKRSLPKSISFDIYKYSPFSKELVKIYTFNFSGNMPSSSLRLHYVLNKLYIVTQVSVHRLNADNSTTLMFVPQFSILNSSTYNNKLLIDYRNYNQRDYFYISSFDEDFNEEILSYIGNDIRIHSLDPNITYKGKLIFTCYHNGQRLCSSDGTSAGTSVIYPSNLSMPRQSKVKLHDDKLYWIHDFGTYTQQNLKLVYYNGSSTGIVNLNNIDVGNKFAFVNDNLVASSKDYNLIIKKDGVFFKHTLNPEHNYYFGELYEMQGYAIYLTKIANSKKFELWHTDGTYEGTFLIKTLNALGDPVGADILTSTPKVFNNKLFFYFRDFNYHLEPWVSNGTSEGTFMLRNIKFEGSSFVDGNFMEYNGKILFIADCQFLGKEIWLTDGTKAGTKPLIDLRQGLTSSEPNLLFTLDDILFASFKNENNLFSLINIDLD